MNTSLYIVWAPRDRRGPTIGRSKVPGAQSYGPQRGGQTSVMWPRGPGTAAVPVPVTLAHAKFPTTATLREFLGAIEKSLAKHLYNTILESRRLPLLQTRYGPSRLYLFEPDRASRDAGQAAIGDHPR